MKLIGQKNNSEMLRKGARNPSSNPKRYSVKKRPGAGNIP